RGREAMYSSTDLKSVLAVGNSPQAAARRLALALRHLAGGHFLDHALDAIGDDLPGDLANDGFAKLRNNASNDLVDNRRRHSISGTLRQAGFHVAWLLALLRCPWFRVRRLRHGRWRKIHLRRFFDWHCDVDRCSIDLRLGGRYAADNLGHRFRLGNVGG